MTTKDAIPFDLAFPAIDDPIAIFEFAMTFDGYREYGSFEASAAAARNTKRASLNELRNELFFAARASRHSEDMEYVACSVGALRAGDCLRQ